MVTYEVLKQKSIESVHDKHFKEWYSQYAVHLTSILNGLFWHGELQLNEAPDSEMPPNTCSHVDIIQCS